MSVTALRPQQGNRFLHQINEIAGLPAKAIVPPQVEEAFHVCFQQSKLPQCHRERLRITLAAAFAGVQLHGQDGSGNAVAKLMGQTAADLAQEPKPLILLHRLLKLGQPLGHLIHGSAEVAQLIVSPRERHGAEITGRDLPRSPFQLLDPPAEPLGHTDRQDNRGQSDKTAQE